MRDKRLIGWMIGSLGCWGLLSFAPLASAQGADDTQARANAIFQEARKAYLEGDYATACPKYEEVVRLKPGFGARLGLGDCYRKQGKLALAWQTYRGIADEAPVVASKATTWADKTTAKKRGDEAQSRLSEIQPELGWMTIALAEPVAALPGIVVHLDGVTVEAARFGAKLPVERGEHVIDASATGKKSWEKSVAMGAGSELVIGVPMLEDEALAPNPPTGPDDPKKPDGGASAGKPNDTSLGPSDSTPKPNVLPDKPKPEIVQYDFFSTPRVFGLGMAAVGVVGLGAGAYFGLDAIKNRDLSKQTGQCVGSVCDGKGYDYLDAAYRSGNLSTGFFIGGGVLLAGGVALFLTAPKKPRPASALVVGPSSILFTGQF